MWMLRAEIVTRLNNEQDHGNYWAMTKNDQLLAARLALNGGDRPRLTGWNDR